MSIQGSKDESLKSNTYFLSATKNYFWLSKFYWFNCFESGLLIAFKYNWSSFSKITWCMVAVCRDCRTMNVIMPITARKISEMNCILQLIWILTPPFKQINLSWSWPCAIDIFLWQKPNSRPKTSASGSFRNYVYSTISEGVVGSNTTWCIWTVFESFTLSFQDKFSVFYPYIFFTVSVVLEMKLDFFYL